MCKDTLQNDLTYQKKKKSDKNYYNYAQGH